jgi:arylsulfatase
MGGYPECEGQRGPPNILFIMTDQQRFDCVGANGNPLIRTPNLDRLAAGSANMLSCFVQAPVCVPSRQTFFTGRYPHCHRNRVNYTPLDERQRLLQSYLQEAGYATGFVGKLHYHPPTLQYALSTGFEAGRLHDAAHCDPFSDYVMWLRSVAPELAERTQYRATDAAPGHSPYRSAIPDEWHETTWCGRESRAMLRSLADRGEPFFLFSSYWRPHAPFEVPEPWSSMYDDVDIPLAQQVGADYIRSLPTPVQALILRGGREPYLIDRQRLEWQYRAYYGAISQIDREVGLTLDVLDELGLSGRTLVVFCSDHGDQLLEHGLGGKNVFFEGSLHIPMMVRLPGTVVPGEYRDLVETTDVLPTLLELCGLPVPESNQGRSFASRLSEGRAGSPCAARRYVFSENIIPEVITMPGGRLTYPYEPGVGVGGILHPDAKMVRTERWKYCYYVGNGSELYDLAEDPHEMHNLADDPACAETVRELRGAILDWLITCDEPEQIAPRWCIM